MMVAMKELKSIDEWEQVLIASRATPVVVYKHSSTCGACSRSLQEMHEAFAYGELKCPGYMVTVQSAPGVSERIAADLRVEHQSPQALIVLNGRACHVADWDSISAADIAHRLRAIEEAHREIFA